MIDVMGDSGFLGHPFALDINLLDSVDISPRWSSGRGDSSALRCVSCIHSLFGLIIGLARPKSLFFMGRQVLCRPFLVGGSVFLEFL